MNKDHRSPATAVVLVSGGLDSILAAKLLQRQNIRVLPLNYTTDYFISQRLREEGAEKMKQGEPDRLMLMEKEIGVPVRRDDISDAYLSILIAPPHGFGKGINPCIDCKIFMLKKATLYMEETGADFIATGEVVGQRPMSQFMKTLKRIEEKSGLQGKLLRPLSAKLLPETIPEQTGLVEREKLLDIQGRSRKVQMALAREWGITAYGQPAGGCYLTDATYARRFRDLLLHEGRDAITREAMILLQVGRHFRLREGVKQIIGRDKWENHFLERNMEGRWTMWVKDYPGPLSLTDGRPGKDDIPVMAALTAAFSDGKREAEVTVVCKTEESEEVCTVKPATKDMIKEYMI